MIVDASEPLVEQRDPSFQRKARVASLDIMRGFTVLLMVFVDEMGTAFPSVDHSPWDNITLADLVMPWFLFMVGTSLAISLRKYVPAQRSEGTRAVFMRSLKLFMVGLLLQGGGWPDVDADPAYTFGYNFATLRFCGILQRIAIAYFAAALFELWLPVCGGPTSPSDSEVRPSATSPHVLVFSTQLWRWLAASSFVLLHRGSA